MLLRSVCSAYLHVMALFILSFRIDAVAVVLVDHVAQFSVNCQSVYTSSDSSLRCLAMKNVDHVAAFSTS